MAVRTPLYLDFANGEIVEFTGGDTISGGNVFTYGDGTGTYTVNTNDMVVYATGTGTINLPDVDATSGYRFWIKNDGIGLITIEPYLSDTIDSYTNLILSPGDAIDLMCIGTKWIIL